MLFLLAIFTLGAADSPSPQQQRAIQILGTDSIDVPTLLENIERRRLHPEDEKRIRRALGQLSSDRFLDREQGTEELLSLGAKVLPLLDRRPIQRASDPEMKKRIEFIRAKLNVADDSQIIWASAVRLQAAVSSKHDITRRLVGMLPYVHTRYLRSAIINAAWRHRSRHDSATQQQDARYFASLSGNMNAAPPKLSTQMAVAWLLHCEHASLADAARTSLKHPTLEMRLASARWLSTSTRGDVALALPTLIALAKQPRPDISAEAKHLLHLFAKQLPASPPSLRKAAKEEFTFESFDLMPLAKADAFRWGVLHVGLFVDFEKDANDLRQGYRQFTYSAQVKGAKAVVKDGRLWLNGKHEEGDQHFSVKAHAIASQLEITEPLTVEARLGGTPGNEIGWHVGISIGKAKFLFHPGYTSGGFRIEDIDSHNYMVANQAMAFTPATNVMHTMRLVASPQPNGNVKVKVEIEDGGSKAVYRYQTELRKDQIGPINQIGLERSGRTGGDAMFDDLRITLRN